MSVRKTTKPTPVEIVKHKDKRVNIPTEELRGFVKDEEREPKTMLYPRDPSLDPQLVWKGKDEQDREDLAVPAVPVYIQEKIHPQALIENLRKTAKAGEKEPELTLFDDFNGIEDFDKKIDFYHYEQHWTNRMILGDSLLVMNSLAEKEGLKGKVQMIYIDPPYGIKFGSNWQVSTRKRDVKDGKAEDATRQPEQVRAFRDTWELGIHSYLAYWRDRLVTAHELLTETGSVFVQIGDENVHLVRSLLDEVFGSENFCSLITFRKKGMTLGSELLEGTVDYILWYAWSKERVKYRRLFQFKSVEGDSHWDRLEEPGGLRRKMTSAELDNHSLLPDGSTPYQLHQLYPAGINTSGLFDFIFEGKTYRPPTGRSWKTNRTGLDRLARASRVEPYQDGITLRYVLKLSDYPATPYNNLWPDLGSATDTVYVVQTNVTVIQRCLLMTTDPGDLVLDPTCGSGTTAFVAEQWGRRWITIDTSRVALALARTRLMSAKYPYYLLADSSDGMMKDAEIVGKVPQQAETNGDIKKGFVYNRIPHVTLGSIANNEDIDAIHAKWPEKLEPVRLELNKLLGKSWEEWQIPREPDKIWPEAASKLHEKWWKLRRDRQKEIDESIAGRADTEILYDQPYEDNKRVRVSGPFTVESLSPHRRFDVEEKIKLKDEGIAGVSMRVVGGGQFALTIIDNLKKAGVQNTKKGERLKFDRLEPFAGEWIHASGDYTEADKSKRVAVCIGPEFGTVGPELIKEAAKEAVRGIGFDTLIVCGFAFDPHVSEETKNYGSLTVLTARMNPDLALGEGFLKKTGAGNLFMIFGEPDIMISYQTDGKVTAEIKGLDIYDPTTGEIRSSSTDDIACWFIDTNYNGESFFVRHAYFTGAEQPYDKLKRALKAEIDEAAWSSLYSTISRPFDKPETGKIAVKVINHYGDEVLRAYEVS